MSFEEFVSVYSLLLAVGAFAFVVGVIVNGVRFYLHMSTDEKGRETDVKMPTSVVAKTLAYIIGASLVCEVLFTAAVVANEAFVGVAFVAIVVFVLIRIPTGKAMRMTKGFPVKVRRRELAKAGYGSSLAILVEQVCLALLVALGVWAMILLAAFPNLLFLLAAAAYSASYGAVFIADRVEQMEPWKLRRSLRTMIRQPMAVAFSRLLLGGIVLPAFIALAIVNIPGVGGQTRVLFYGMVIVTVIHSVARGVNKSAVLKLRTHN